MRTAACIGLVALGMSGVVARGVDLSLVASAGSVLLLAPQPAVFSDRNISGTAQVRIMEEGKVAHVLALDRHLYARFRGPLARIDTYMHAILVAPQSAPTFWAPVLGFALCDGGPGARELGLPLDVRAFELWIAYRSRPPRRWRRFRVDCATPPRGQPLYW